MIIGLLQHTLPLEVFTQRNFVEDLVWLKLNFIFKKNEKIAFWATLWGNWKTCGRLSIRHNWTFSLSFSYGWDAISGTPSKSTFSEGDGSVWAQISDRKVSCLPTTVGVRKLEWLPVRAASRYLQCIVCFCYKARVWRTDRQTDGRTVRQNYDS